MAVKIYTRDENGNKVEKPPPLTKAQLQAALQPKKRDPSKPFHKDPSVDNFMRKLYNETK
jgi:hypothetical protein